MSIHQWVHSHNTSNYTDFMKQQTRGCGRGHNCSRQGVGEENDDLTLRWEPKCRTTTSNVERDKLRGTLKGKLKLERAYKTWWVPQRKTLEGFGCKLMPHRRLKKWRQRIYNQTIVHIFFKILYAISSWLHLHFLLSFANTALMKFTNLCWIYILAPLPFMLTFRDQRQYSAPNVTYQLFLFSLVTRIGGASVAVD
jgi:hypothetical protein